MPRRKRQWSLRSDENGIDVAAVAKANGGGGHARASGYEQVMDMAGSLTR
jgi:nanoRNase/pAp phosphatase (c-di-AMP/oligoRNAs hydrolase)